jgi:hypothetical protein
MSVRVSIDFNDEQEKLLYRVKDHFSKRIGTTMSKAVLIRHLLSDYEKRYRMEGENAKNQS